MGDLPCILPVVYLSTSAENLAGPTKREQIYLPSFPPATKLSKNDSQFPPPRSAGRQSIERDKRFGTSPSSRGIVYINESLRLARVWLRAVYSTKFSKGTTLEYDTSTTTTPNRSHAERERGPCFPSSVSRLALSLHSLGIARQNGRWWMWEFRFVCLISSIEIGNLRGNIECSDNPLGSAAPVLCIHTKLARSEPTPKPTFYICPHVVSLQT